MHVDGGIAERLGELGRSGRELVEHLVGCETCRLRVLMTIQESGLVEEPQEGEALPLPPAVLRPLLAGLARAFRESNEDEERARDQKWRRLLDLPPDEAWAALAAEDEPGPAVARRILPETAMTGEAPGNIERAAQLVLAIGLQLERESRDRNLPGGTEVCGRGWTALAEVARLRGDRAQAEVFYGMAPAALDSAELDSEERALYCRLLARLRSDQGRTDEALALLERASGLYMALAEHDDVGEVLEEKGRLLLEELDVDGAELALRAAVNLIAPARRPWAATRARLGLALCAAERGREGEAAREWWAEGEESDTWTELERYRRTVLYAELSERTGAGARAARLLRVAVEGLADRGELYDAAVGTAALLGVIASLGAEEPETERKVPRELQKKLAPLARDENPWAVLCYLFDLAETRRGQNEIFKVAREYLDRARHNPTLACHPRWRPRAALSWGRLPPATKEEVCRYALVDPSAVVVLSAGEIGPALRLRLAWVYEAYTEVRIVFVEERGQDEERRRSR